jgi:hypothetical protein
MKNDNWLKDAYCFNCEAEKNNTPVSIEDARKALDETGLVRCEKHIIEWRKKYAE